MANTKNNTTAKKAETAKRETAAPASAPAPVVEEVVRPVVPKEINPNQFVTERTYRGAVCMERIRCDSGDGASGTA